MKKIKYLFSSLILLSLLVSVISCENTNENLVKDRGVAVVPGISNLEPAFYTTDFENTFIEFDVDLPEGETVDEAELYATFNGKTALIQPITSFPITITLKLQDVMTKLGLTENDVDVVDNNLFDFNIQPSLDIFFSFVQVSYWQIQLLLSFPGGWAKYYLLCYVQISPLLLLLLRWMFQVLFAVL
jgi:hypothetical protein